MAPDFPVTNFFAVNFHYWNNLFVGGRQKRFSRFFELARFNVSFFYFELRPRQFQRDLSGNALENIFLRRYQYIAFKNKEIAGGAFKRFTVFYVENFKCPAVFVFAVVVFAGSNQVADCLGLGHLPLMFVSDYHCAFFMKSGRQRLKFIGQNKKSRHQPIIAHAVDRPPASTRRKAASLNLFLMTSCPRTDFISLLESGTRKPIIRAELRNRLI